MIINSLSVPEDVKVALRELEKQIEFHKASDKGQNGHVLFGTNRLLGRPDVVKLYYWESGDHAEPELLAKLEHPNILKVYHAASIDAEWAFFTTKFCDGGDLDSVLEKGPLGLREAIDAVMMVASGVSFLHGNGFLHRDLKLENVYRDNDQIVIGDFGSVSPCDAHGHCKTLTRHSLLYRPPEATVTNDYFKESDVYQLGLMLFQLLGGYLPYDERDWLTSKQKTEYDALKGATDKGDYATKIIEEKINKGRLLDMDTLPAYVPKSVVTFIRKATRVEIKNRHKSVADFIATLNNMKRRIPDWRPDGGHIVLHRPKKRLRVLANGSTFAIEKDVGSGWKKQHALTPKTMRDAVIIAEIT